MSIPMPSEHPLGLPTSEGTDKLDAKKGVQDDIDDAETEYTGSVGMSTWSTLASSWTTGPGDQSSNPSRLHLSSRVSKIEEEIDDNADLGTNEAGAFIKAKGAAAATSAAAAAAANAAAPREKAQQIPSDDVPKEPPTASISVGSALHGTGMCSPCVWHWKAQGCNRGSTCGYCHLCPEGELKTRKKAKLANLRSGANDSDDENGDENGSSPAAKPTKDSKVAPKEDLDEKPRAPVVTMTSVGSSMHGSGECRPCAWFWKAQGCQNGQECRHCHLCPEGEIKMRKKQKVDILRKDRPTDAPNAACEIREEDPQGDIKPPPGLAEPAKQADGQKKIEEPGEMASVGSALHGTGECRPCAWFWKAQGCENGKDCRHCHLCPDGEIRSRKKEKVSNMRQDKHVEEEKQRKEMEVAHMKALAKHSNPFCMPFFQQPNLPLPSVGSALHGTGMCRPCAWAWKGKGCENGYECRHCHLCPEGEIKSRRKMKVAVLRHHGAMQQQIEMAQDLLKQAQDTWGDEEQTQWEAFYQQHQDNVFADPSPARIKTSSGDEKLEGSPSNSPAWVTAQSTANNGSKGISQVSAVLGGSSPSTCNDEAHIVKIEPVLAS